ncbi:unnamed protein product [Schistocephalus solidus]|uniref:tRNA-dihydrouridine(16/17) synthase [NAD(P)(+)] n=1 Tax=Schistocephalus solidus TaxID=70667 RepID=A0A3P7D3V6_SCHSO|nr:unnamed protein product [Schistocephalus solidus]
MRHVRVHTCVGVFCDSEVMGVIFEKNKLVLAPMVDQSELAWRMLARKYGAQITFTPMMNINQFIRDPKYRKKVMEFSDEDRPLIVQFCGNSPELFAQSAKFVEDYCDGVNLNLGCPQGIARRGHYGSYLQDEWELISSMVKVPVSVKIRIFPDVDRTVAYAKMLEAAGAAFIAVHGRTREQNGQKTGLADWEQIRAVKSAVSIPIIANGNILYFEDIEKCLRATKADALMSAGNCFAISHTSFCSAFILSFAIRYYFVTLQMTKLCDKSYKALVISLYRPMHFFGTRYLPLTSRIVPPPVAFMR